MYTYTKHAYLEYLSMTQHILSRLVGGFLNIPGWFYHWESLRQAKQTSAAVAGTSALAIGASLGGDPG